VTCRCPFYSSPFLRSRQELEVLHTLEHRSRIHDVKFVRRVDDGGEVLLVVPEDKRTTVYGVPPNSDIILCPVAHLVGHGSRVKAIDAIRISSPSSLQDSTTIVCSVLRRGQYIFPLLPPPDGEMSHMEKPTTPEKDAKRDRESDSKRKRRKQKWQRSSAQRLVFIFA